ncbi:MAG: amidohydrolase family protein, partial [Erysipelotrichaceae bacterium]|nr:amidohydrolase family protein [Erysipelotrichaceae bacterium]
MIIQSKKVWIANGFMPAQLEIRDGKIVQIYDHGTKEADEDYGELRIVPGFIDVHTHGAYGFDTNDGDEEGLRNWTRRLPIDEGVTAYQPTTITQSVEVLDNALKNVVKVVESGYEGAEILGVHFEGPYLDQQYKGAQPPEFILDTDVEQFKHYQETAHGLIHYITLAPEHDKDYALTRWCAENG